MPGAARAGDPCTTGHDCDTTSTVIGGSGNVTANGIAILRVGDPVAPHTIKQGKACVPHDAVITGGSPTVLINGIPMARVGDPVDVGGTITGGSSTVIVN